tara:strand:+ start:696 stop:926 length:231 start_codon:yes stop_codon:yes gene_type:complete
MFTPEDFELPLESQLRMRVIHDEVDNCTDVKELQKQLKASTEMMMNYQHILHRILREKIEENLTEFNKLLNPADNS